VASHGHYLERMRSQLLREIGWTIANRVRDPRVPMIVSATDMKLAADTRNATVYVNVFGDDDKAKQEAVAALNHAAPFIQRVVADRVSVRHFPKLLFRLDNSIERGAHIEELLREVQDDLV
jgi:ribosome-binding factor A